MPTQRFEGVPAAGAGPGPAAVRANLERILGVVAARAREARRDPASVTIVGVTKSVGAAEAAWLLAAGVTDLGENRAEELVRKASDGALAGARWHMIGTYQRRKVRDTLSSVAVIHSIHAVALGSAVALRARELGRTVDCLVQVNVSGEASKQGFSEAEAPGALEELRALPGLRLRGLMTMAPEGAPPAECRRIFARTRALRDRLADPGLPLADLSMGMSSDYGEAVLEGATLIRIGTALFDMGSAGGPS